MELRQVYTTPDGKTFDTKKEAMDYLRRPKIAAALKTIKGTNAEMVDWLVENQEKVEMAFDIGTIRRVSKTEHNQLTKSLEHLVATYANDKKLHFLVENSDVVKEVFRWPTVKRMDDAEKAVATRNTLVGASDSEELADWIVANKDAVLAAYEAGIEKRPVNPKAQEALAAYRERVAAEKAAKEKATG